MDVQKTSVFLALVFLLLASAARAETSGTINASAYNFSAPVVGLFGYTVENCDVDASCFGFRCYVDFDGEVDDSDTGKPSGTCMPRTVTQCYHDTRWYAPSTNVRNSNVTYYTCLSNETGKWILATCDSGKTFSYDTTTEAGNCTTPSSPTTSSGSGGSNATAAKKTLKFTQVPGFVELVQGQTVSVEITFRNAGTVSLTNIRLSISGIDAGWYSILPSVIAAISPNNTNSFTVTFTVPQNAEVKSYAMSFNVTAQDGTNDTQPSFLRILPAPGAQAGINQSYESYKVLLEKLERNITDLGAMNVNKQDIDSLNTTVSLAKTKLKEAKSLIEKNDYFAAKLLLDEVGDLIESAHRQLSRARIEEPAPPQPLDPTLLIIIIAAVIGAAAFVAYLLWPTRESGMLAKGFEKKRKFA